MRDVPVGAAAAPDGYRYLRHLGAGGFGDVHLAEHLSTGRPVAIKYIHRHLLADPDVLARFRREAQVLAATDVATVVRVYDLCTTSDPAYLVMEHVPGVTLWDLVERAPLPPQQVVPVLRDVAEALRVMAAHGLVHRDIKPSNVFVLPSGRAKLGDFGLARLMADDAGFRTVGAPAGTPAYFPPEVSSGDAEATVESDAYSFAVMAYEVLVGARPITAPDAISLVTAHWTQPPRPLGDAMPGCPSAVDAVLMRGLAKVPWGRPLPHEVVDVLEAVPDADWPTADRPRVPVPQAPDLVAAYDDVTGAVGPGTGAAPVTVPASWSSSDPVTVRAPTTATLPDPSPPRGRARPVRGAGRGRRSAAGGVVVVVLAAAAAAGWTLRDDDAPPPPGLVAGSVTLVAEPAVVRCPRARVELVATIATNGGAGHLTVTWTLPDGSPGPEQPFAVADGQREVVAALSTTLTGTNPVAGRVSVVVDPAGLRAATPVTYRCPAPPSRRRR